MRFSERYGYKPVREIIQKDSISQDLKNRIWSLIFSSFLQKYIDTNQLFTEYSSVVGNIWSHFCKIPLDEMESLRYYTSRSRDISKIKSNIFESEWYTIYDLVEYILNYENGTTPYNVTSDFEITFTAKVNQILEQENSAYRIINNQVTEITSEQEIQSIEEALANTNPYSGVQQHLNQSLKLMSDRQNPDYRNSIKESISAVESICKIVTNEEKATLGPALKIIENKYGLHPALKGSLSQLYGYTSDGDGIRHAMLEESNLSYIDAKFMLVACTNFINYLIEKTKD
ncbi:AbiJ-NTD4 domain-containing protein [Acinetobacter piscicola]|uniref:AbiJ-NTD4 domain-containing protein n=1 Tax=Acinetobacter piscicola TaxID=2006115 RepID=UPI0035581A76